MEITGKIFQILPPETGQGKNGPWKKQFFIVETLEQYPKKLCFEVWGDKVKVDNLSVGQAVKVDFDVESREWQGKWFTSIKPWRVSLDGESGNTYRDPEPAQDFSSPAAGLDVFDDTSGGDDLPF